MQLAMACNMYTARSCDRVHMNLVSCLYIHSKSQHIYIYIYICTLMHNYCMCIHTYIYNIYIYICGIDVLVYCASFGIFTSFFRYALLCLLLSNQETASHQNNIAKNPGTAPKFAHLYQNFSPGSTMDPVFTFSVFTKKLLRIYMK